MKTVLIVLGVVVVGYLVVKGTGAAASSGTTGSGGTSGLSLGNLDSSLAGLSNIGDTFSDYGD